MGQDSVILYINKLAGQHERKKERKAQSESSSPFLFCYTSSLALPFTEGEFSSKSGGRHLMVAFASLGGVWNRSLDDGSPLIWVSCLCLPPSTCVVGIYKVPFL